MAKVRDVVGASARRLAQAACTAAVMVCMAGTSAAQAPWSVPDAVYVNGNVLTVDKDFSAAEAFAIKGDRFVAVGKTADIRALAGPQTSVVDLKGQTVLPGFNDGHVHILSSEPDFESMPLNSPKTIAELQAAVKATAAQRKPGEWLTFTQNDWHPADLKEKRFPTRWELDAAAPNNPVYLLRGGQTIVANSMALKLANVTRDSTPPEGRGVITKDPKTGEPTGLLISNARFLVRDVVPKFPDDYDRLTRLVAEGGRFLNATGVTSARLAGLTTYQVRGMAEARRRGLLTVRLGMMFEPRSRQEPLEDVIDQMRNFGPATGFGDEWLRIAGVKLYYDGAVESALMNDPYETDKTYYGVANYSPEKYYGMLMEAARLGWSVGVHAAGDKAVQDTIDQYAEVNKTYPIKPLRWSIEHAMLGAEARFDVIRDLGIVLSEQERTFYQYTYPGSRTWGLARAKKIIELRKWLDNGMIVVGGTDQLPDAKTANLQFLMIWSSVTRSTQALGVLAPEQRITRAEAIRLHTAAPAYVTYEEDVKGSIQPGMLADFIVISDDIMKVPEAKIKDLAVLETFVGGKSVYKKP